MNPIPGFLLCLFCFVFPLLKHRTRGGNSKVETSEMYDAHKAIKEGKKSPLPDNGWYSFGAPQFNVDCDGFVFLLVV